MKCEFKAAWEDIIHRSLHVCEAALAAQSKKTSLKQEQDEIATIVSKIMSAMDPITPDIPKYRMGLAYFAILGGFCDMMTEHNRDLDKATEHCDRVGPS